MPLTTSAARYITEHRKVWAPKTTITKMGAIRGWATWAGEPDVLAGYKAPTPAKATPHPLPGGLDDVLAMIEAGSNRRQRALVALCGLCGLRVSEALAVKPEHVNRNARQLTVRGKGDVTRRVPISSRAWPHLRDAIETAELTGAPTLVEMREAWARDLITALGKRAGVGRHVSSHDLRATLATEAYDKTKDLRAVQEVLGHASARTTEVYTGVSVAAMRAAVDL